MDKPRMPNWVWKARMIGVMTVFYGFPLSHAAYDIAVYDLREEDEAVGMSAEDAGIAWVEGFYNPGADDGDE